MTVNNEERLKDTETGAPNDQKENPVYQKPILRKYDQIDQVKPYGPSELEAG